MTVATPGHLVRCWAVTERSDCRHCHTEICRLLPSESPEYRCEPSWWHAHTGDVECRQVAR